MGVYEVVMSTDDGWALWSNFLTLVTPNDVGSPDSLRMGSII
jgi:beta-glucanase (GH16 family)